ncbi:MAG: hypothetical protein GY869_02765, partial [Planctomycetes bacterium]|nr:hypothetical protein [Planctomycetota bacterium]
FSDTPGAIDGSGDFSNDNAYDIILGDWSRDSQAQGTISIFEGGALSYPVPVVASTNLPHTYAAPGNYNVTATVVDDDGSSSGSVIASVFGYPVAEDDGVTTEENKSVLITAADLLENDWDPDLGDVLSIIDVDTTGTIGSVTVFGLNQVLYNPNGQFEYLGVGETATDTFSYTIDDGNPSTGGQETAQVTVTITGVNNAPTAVLDHDSTDEDTPLVITTTGLLINDTDPDVNDTSTIISLDTSETIGQVTNNGDGTVTYDPNGHFEYLTAGQTATDTFTYTMEDSQGATSTATVEITIYPVLPTVTAFDMSNDTGINDDDQITKDTTPTLRFFFSEIVYGDDSDITVFDPDLNPITPDSITGWGTNQLVVTLSTPLELEGAYTIILSGKTSIKDAGGNLLNDGTDEIANFTLDTTALQVDTIALNGFQTQRSNITHLRIVFDGDANIGSLISAGVIDQLIKIYSADQPNTPLTWLDNSRFNWNSYLNILTLDLTIDGIGGSDLTALENGYFEVRINTVGLRDLAGNQLLDNDGLVDNSLTINHSTSAATIDFFRLESDANGDAKVDTQDLDIWQQNYDPLGLNNNNPGMGDWNLDNVIDGGDLALWQQNLQDTEFIPPLASSVTINGGNDQRSNLTELAIQFTESMNIDALIQAQNIDDYVKLYDLTDLNQPISWLDDSYFVWNGVTNTLTIDLTIDGIDGSNQTALPDGWYEIRLDTSALTDLVGNALWDNDGSTDSSLLINQSSSSAQPDFFRQQADANGDTRVDNDDLTLWMDNYDPLGINPNTPDLGDWDLDGVIDGGDLALWQQNYDPAGLPTPVTPTINTVVINDGETQRSNITTIALQFNQGMNFNTLIYSDTIGDYVKLYNSADPAHPLVWLDEEHFDWDQFTNTLTIDLTIDDFRGSSLTALTDGSYQLKLDTAVIEDSLGTKMLDDDGSVDGWLTIERSTAAGLADFFRLLTDSTGDGIVDQDDLDVWQLNYDPTGINANTPAMGDWNLDGLIDGADLTLWQLAANSPMPPETQSPTISSIVINDGQTQRSNITSIDIQFDEEMNLDTVVGSDTIDDQIRLYELSDPDNRLSWLDESYFSWETTTQTLSIDLTIDGFGGSSQTQLVNGGYQIRMNTAVFEDLYGNTLLDNDLRADGWLTINQSSTALFQDFFRLKADANGDASVDLNDLAIWQQNYDPLAQNINSPDKGDWNLDGKIDGADLAVWQQNYGSL